MRFYLLMAVFCTWTVNTATSNNTTLEISSDVIIPNLILPFLRIVLAHQISITYQRLHLHFSLKIDLWIYIGIGAQLHLVKYLNWLATALKFFLFSSNYWNVFHIFLLLFLFFSYLNLYFNDAIFPNHLLPTPQSKLLKL